MAWGPDKLSDLCERLMGELASPAVFLMVSDEAAARTKYGVATEERRFPRALPIMLRIIADGIAAATHASTAIIEVESTYALECAALLRELDVVGVALIVMRGKKGSGFSIGGLWCSNRLIESLRDIADAVDRDLQAS